VTVAPGPGVELPGEGPAGPGWREELAAFKGGAGHDLVGILTLPAPASPLREPGTGNQEPGTTLPAVAVVHGWGTYRTGPHRMLVELCRELARRGCPALRFDLSGRGDSGGEYWETDLDVMIADTRAAAAWLAARCPGRPLAAAGLCSGANVALGAAAAAGEPRLVAVAALSALPFQKQRRAGQAAARAGGTLAELARKALRGETWRRLWRGEASPLGALRRLLLGEGGRSARAGAPGGPARNLKDSRRDIQAELADFRGRLLFVHGAADAEGLSGWREVFAPFLEAHAVDHRHALIAGADHDYHSLETKRQAIAAAAEFLAG
jgi:dienelactone hydrolase